MFQIMSVISNIINEDIISTYLINNLGTFFKLDDLRDINV